jgi:hypothetical protein
MIIWHIYITYVFIITLMLITFQYSYKLIILTFIIFVIIFWGVDKLMIGYLYNYNLLGVIIYLNKLFMVVSLTTEYCIYIMWYVDFVKFLNA